MLLCAASYHDVSSSSYTHYASSYYSACTPEKISDNIYNNVYYDAWQAQGYTGWVTIQLPQMEKVEKLSINRVYYKLRDFTFSGSNDNTNWTNLYVGTSPDSLGWITFDLVNPQYFTYYRLNVANTWGDWAIVYEWELLVNDASAVPEPSYLFGLGAMLFLIVKKYTRG